ncbi:hypothetical protein [Hydrogenivirga sp. 128-5-R1-1]|uniref:T3SS (YopN, CesT) and YbjN peptide-binding chaperone 1 n=1 Tax=Hydrogenivirga sp. 128-5-R1-1 TaxID=392423 RepID=UPI00015EF906|nr:hypothetical protein [Hydrogenivirga sp. 128-5-R1-1]EDP74539.1 hypothetical protein HG1285_15059 [Hydrogenivirga sp. 128-5-R1-1]
MEDRLERIALLIERYLGQVFGTIRVYREDGEFLIPWGSTVINVEVVQEGDDVLIHVYSPVALRVKPDKDLMRFLLMENGSLSMCSFSVELERGFMDIILGTKVKFDFVNKDLLSYIAINVGNLANEYCKEIIAVFGGISFKEYVEREKLEKKPYGDEKVLHDIFEVEGIKMSLELFRSQEQDSYIVVGKILDTGQVFLRAERKRDIQEVFDLLERLKKFLLEKDIASLKKSLRHYEVEEYFLYNVLAGKEKDKVKKLKEMEREIQFLTDMLMKGEISHEEYRKRISDIERMMGL